MERHAFAMKVKKGKMNDYRRKLGEIWPELTAFLDRNKVSNFSIWNACCLVTVRVRNSCEARRKGVRFLWI